MMILQISLYLLGMFITFTVTYLYLYERFKEDRVILPNVKSISSNLDSTEKTLVVLLVLVFPLGFIGITTYYTIRTILKLPNKLVNLLFFITNYKANKTLKTRINLLQVHDLIKVAKYSSLNDLTPYAIEGIATNSITVKGIEYPKKHIVLIKDELIILADPYNGE